jgi:hypothetical protein
MKDEPTKRKLANGKWQLDYGYDATGKNPRRQFDTEDAADKVLDAYRKEAKKKGEYWARLTPVKRDTIVATLQAIEKDGLTLDGVWADHQRWRKDNAQSITMPMPYEDVVKSFKAAKLLAGVGERYVNEVCGVFERFGAGREKLNFHEIVANDLQVWLDTQKTPAGKLWSKSSKRTNQIRFSSLWEHAIAKGWCSLNITERLTQIGKITHTNKIYDNRTVMNILAGALSNELTQQIIAPLAIGFFGCMRPEEVESKKAVKANNPKEPPFGWDCINLKNPGATLTPLGNVPYVGTITLETWHTKKGDQRVIRLQQTCVDWLELAKELDNPLPPVNERRLVDQVCELIGLDEWLRDGLRKNCATHLRPVYKLDSEVVSDCGNSVRVLLEHYAALRVSEDVSREYWKITPDAVRRYMKTKAWKQVLFNAQKAKQERLASEIAKSEN